MKISAINSTYPTAKNNNNKPTFKGFVSERLIQHMESYVKEGDKVLFTEKINELKNFVKRKFKHNIVLIDDKVEARIHLHDKKTHKYYIDSVTISPISFVRTNILGKYDKQQFTYNVDEGPGIKNPFYVIDKVLCMTEEEIAQANKGSQRKYVPTDNEIFYYDAYNRASSRKEIVKKLLKSDKTDRNIDTNK